jgi:hypothetical protein
MLVVNASHRVEVTVVYVVHVVHTYGVPALSGKRSASERQAVPTSLRRFLGYPRTGVDLRFYALSG